MKKNKLNMVVAIALCVSLGLSSCIGSFKLTNKVLGWNEGVGNKFVNELVFIAFHIIPVYELTVVADILVLNSIEFWSGENLVSQSTKEVKGENGDTYLVTTDENGYTITNQKDNTTIGFVFDSNDNSCSGKGAAVENVDIKFGYCTEFIIMLDKEFDEKTEADFKAFLTSIGDSIVCVALDDIVKVHVHTNHPGQAFEKALEYGQLTKMKVDNMREEHNQKVVAQSELQAAAAKQAMEKNSEAEQKKAEPAKDFGFITIAPGSGIAEIFKGLGVDEVIEGGQTMNPSTEDILNAADKINAKTIYVLPNNSNIILAANQAASIVEDKELVVIPTKTVPQGITAMINFETTRSAKDNGDAMTDSLSTVKSGQLTYAVRDTSIDGKEIKKDNYLGLGDKGLAAVGTDMDETLLEMIESMMSDEAELISVYYGADIEEAAAEAVVSKIEEKFPDVDVELQFGGQPVYYYIVSVE